MAIGSATSAIPAIGVAGSMTSKTAGKLATKKIVSSALSVGTSVITNTARKMNNPDGAQTDYAEIPKQKNNKPELIRTGLSSNAEIPSD